VSCAARRPGRAGGHALERITAQQPIVAQFIGTPQMNMVARPDVAQFQSALSMRCRPAVTGPASREPDLEPPVRTTAGACRELWRHWAPRRWSTSAPGVHSAGGSQKTAPRTCRMSAIRSGSDRRHGCPSVRLEGSGRSAVRTLICGGALSMSAPLVMLHLGLGFFHRAHQAWYLLGSSNRGETAGFWPEATPAGRDGADSQPRGARRHVTHVGDRSRPLGREATPKITRSRLLSRMSRAWQV